jgi:hypothetical protein
MEYELSMKALGKPIWSHSPATDEPETVVVYDPLYELDPPAPTPPYPPWTKKLFSQYVCVLLSNALKQASLFVTASGTKELQLHV